MINRRKFFTWLAASPVVMAGGAIAMQASEGLEGRLRRLEERALIKAWWRDEFEEDAMLPPKFRTPR